MSRRTAPTIFFLMLWLGMLFSTGSIFGQSSPSATKPDGAPAALRKPKPSSEPQPTPVASPTKTVSPAVSANSEPRKPPRRFTGRPGELSPEEEDRLDAIIERFIQHDLGIRPDPKAVQEFQQLGVEAIPALVRALNRTAPLAHRCPPAMIAKKLNSLMLRVEDVEVLDFIRREVGAGIRSGPNVAFLDSVRFNAMLRKRELLSRTPPPHKSLFPGESPAKPIRSPGEKP
ncbi:MAG: hypothetical protein NZM42_12140 [Gemmatales bacterium]|nr:hypothetical protein [Gemmatales bacterium]MDW8223841.1 hypothetical protein [Gemmatales bacterium]